MTISSSITYTRQEMCVLMLQHYLPWFSLIIFTWASISHFLNFIVESNILYPFYKHHLNESKLLDHRSISKIEKKVYVRTLVSTCNIWIYVYVLMNGECLSIIIFYLKAKYEYDVPRLKWILISIKCLISHYSITNFLSYFHFTSHLENDRPITKKVWRQRIWI